MIDSLMEKVKFCRRAKAKRKQAGLDVMTYHPKLKKRTQIMEKLEQLLHQDESVSKYLLLYQRVRTAV